MDPQNSERLHVLLGYACNNNCVFCMEEDRATRAQRILEVPPETVRELMERSIRRHREAGSGPPPEVMFTSGEPLLNRHFLRYVAWARELGFSSIGVISNGRLFTYEKLARRALAAGLNHIVISVHGATSIQHDRLTRTAASYAQTILGLRTLARLKADYDFRLHTATVVNRRNFRDLRAIWDSLQGLRVDQHVFNAVQPVGRAEAHFDALVPRFTELVAAFRDFVGGLALPSREPGPGQVFLLDVPYCLTEDLPDEVRGFVERYQYYEHEEGLDDALLWSEDVRCPTEAAAVVAGGGDGPELRRLTRRALDETRKSKRDACRRCRHVEACDGVWDRYLDAHGWEEFQPVERGREPTDGAPDPGSPRER